MIRALLGVLLIASLVAGRSAVACRPNGEWLALPLATKLSGNGFFVGKVISIDEVAVTWKVITPGGPAAHLKAGATIVLKRGKHGTCGSLTFAVGETWLFDGNDVSFSASSKLEAVDFKDGSSLESVKRNVVARLEKT